MPVSKQTLKAKVRTKASQVLFPLLETLNVRAALIGSAGLALIYPGHRATQELVVAVDHDDPTLRFPKLVSMIRAKDPSHFSSPSMKKETMTFQAKEVPEIGTKPCTIQFMFVKGMFGFSIDLTRSIVVQTFPVMPVPWVFLVLLEQWAKGGKKSRGAGKKITKDIIRALKVICAGCQDWAEFDIALAFFPCAKDRLSMLEAVDHVGTRTQMESIRRNTSISSLGLSGDIPRGSTPSATLHKIPETQSLLPQQPPALSSVPCIPPPSAGAPRVVDRDPAAIPPRPPPSSSLSNKSSTSTAAPTVVEHPSHVILSNLPPTTSAGFSLSKAYDFRVKMVAWTGGATECSTEALLAAFEDSFKDSQNWSSVDVAAEFEAAFPLMSRRRLQMIRESALQTRMQKAAAERQPVVSATASHSGPVDVKRASPLQNPAISGPLLPPVHPVRNSVPSSREPGAGPHDHTFTLNNIAWDVVNTLRKAGLRCAFVGSMGCQLYGNKRLPENLDVLVLPPPGTSPNQEVIKKGMARNGQFFTTPVVDAARAHSLFRYIPPQMTLPPNFKRRFCKVNVLLPSVTNLPYLNEKQVNEVEGLPVVPVLVLLLHKLQGWEDYLKCPEMHKFRQHMVDVEDIKHLLGSVGEMPVKMFRPWSERELLGEGFVDASKARVKRFCVTFPETAVHWKGLGFELA